MDGVEIHIVPLPKSRFYRMTLLLEGLPEGHRTGCRSISLSRSRTDSGRASAEMRRKELFTMHMSYMR